MAQEIDKEFVEYIVKQIVNHPDDVKIERSVDEMGVLLTLKVNPEDMALVIGKRGSTAKAIRTLARIIGMRNHARVNFRIAEPNGDGGERSVISKPVEDVVGELNM